MKNLLYFIILILAISDYSVAQESQYRISHRTVPPEFVGGYQFLEFIKYSKEPEGAFQAKLAPHWNAKKMLKCISDSGITYNDVNDSQALSFTVKDIFRQIKQRRGRAFEIFAHLSYIYSTPYKQYSQLSFRRESQFYIIEMPWYRLKFNDMYGQFRLREIDYLELEGE
jgi:hypothetical protein